MARAPAHAHHSPNAALGAGADLRLDILPDRVICGACREEVLTPGTRRFRYPFAHCSVCGPSYSLVMRPPAGRAGTTLAPFEPCPDCERERRDPADLHCGLPTIACPQCGPQVRLIRFDGRPVRVEQHSMLDAVDAACSLIQRGEVIAIKGPGGYELACDATNAAAIVRLRRAKQNGTRPLPLMARSLHIIARYCAIGLEEELALTSRSGPLVSLRATGEEHLPDDIAPGLTTLAFSLPANALHLLLLQRMSRPVVMTSGNLTGEPPIADDAEAARKLGLVVSFALTHDQQVVHPSEPSLVKVIARKPRLLRRGRGHMPEALRLPEGFEEASYITALGTDRQTAFCLVKGGAAIPSAHFGALPSKDACLDYRDAICHYRTLLRQDMTTIAVDAHPDRLSSHLGRSYAAQWGLKLVEVQHQHAHVASCLAENRYPLEAPPVLGIVLDGAERGDDGTDWGGEFLCADYRGCERLAMLKPIRQRMDEDGECAPWLRLYAHLSAAMGWWAFNAQFSGLELCRQMRDKVRALAPVEGLDAPVRLDSSCAGLIDAVAAALGLCRDQQSYPGEAALCLGAVVDEAAFQEAAQEGRYPVLLKPADREGVPFIDPSGMWLALLHDLASATPARIAAARFHAWLASSIAAMATRLSYRPGRAGPRFETVALSGSCFQNRFLLEESLRLLRKENFVVLSQERLPPHDGGLALGQAAIAAAAQLDGASPD